MSTDRELLELAAKAAGLRVKSFIVNADDDFAGLLVKVDGQPKFRWNPLADDGDALRLAVKLKLALALDSCCAMDHRRDGSHDGDWWGGGSDVHAGVSHEECDPCAATRRAIVRAAAEIGKQCATEGRDRE